MSSTTLMNKFPNGIKFLLTGVGGQGTILASNLLADLGLALDYDVKKAEIHGMSQRGGTVVSYVRWGKEVYSPIISKGEADIVIGFEKLEGLRMVEQIKRNGLFLINNYSIVPVTVSSGLSDYPDDQAIQNSIELYTPNNYWINGLEIAEEIGYPKASNVVLLGGLSALMSLDTDLFLQVLAARIPAKYFDFNEKAFLAGFKTMQELIKI